MGRMEEPFNNFPSMMGSEKVLFSCSRSAEEAKSEEPESGEPEPPIDHFSYILVIVSVRDATDMDRLLFPLAESPTVLLELSWDDELLLWLPLNREDGGKTVDLRRDS